MVLFSFWDRTPYTAHQPPPLCPSQRKKINHRRSRRREVGCLFLPCHTLLASAVFVFIHSRKVLGLFSGLTLTLAQFKRELAYGVRLYIVYLHSFFMYSLIRLLLKDIICFPTFGYMNYVCCNVYVELCMMYGNNSSSLIYNHYNI